MLWTFIKIMHVNYESLLNSYMWKWNHGVYYDWWTESILYGYLTMTGRRNDDVTYPKGHGIQGIIVLDYTQKRILIEKGENDESCNGFIGGRFSNSSRSDSQTDEDEDKDETRNEDGMVENQMLSDVSGSKDVGRMDREEEEEERLEGEDEIGSME